MSKGTDAQSNPHPDTEFEQMLVEVLNAYMKKVEGIDFFFNDHIDYEDPEDSNEPGKDAVTAILKAHTASLEQAQKEAWFAGRAEHDEEVVRKARKEAAIEELERTMVAALDAEHFSEYLVTRAATLKGERRGE